MVKGPRSGELAFSSTPYHERTTWRERGPVLPPTDVCSLDQKALCICNVQSMHREPSVAYRSGNRLAKAERQALDGPVPRRVVAAGVQLMKQTSRRIQR
jgi:hypothetical protein